MIGLLGKKLGMTHVYDPYGRRLSVTAIQAGPCTVLGLRDAKTDKYSAVQLGFEPIAEKRLSKPRLGQFKKIGQGAFRYVRELRLDDQKLGKDGKAQAIPEFKVGEQLNVSIFEQYELVDVRGISIGKGFQGGMKRWHWHGGNATHGGMQGREPGSIGSTTTPGRVWKGHHLPGHMGDAQITTQNLRIVQLDPEHNIILVEGPVPGAEDGLVFITKSKKRTGVVRKPVEITVEAEVDETLSKTAKAASKKLKTPTAGAAKAA
jgi:large subunit ribosomal protein L3